MSNIMVCVTGQRSCERLIMRGVNKKQGESSLHVVHCTLIGKHFLNKPDEADAIEYLYNAAKIAGANLTMLRTGDVLATLTEYARQNKIELIILGASHKSNDAFAARLKQRLPEVEIDIME